jgi:DNA-binding NarL/FixJ family response regulator
MTLDTTPGRGAQHTRVFIVDDHALVREWLGNLLRREPDLVVVGEADEPVAALAAMTNSPPDVAVIDVSLKQGSGLELIKDLRARLPNVEIVVLSMHDSVSDFERAFRAGATGYVMKRESTGQIVEAIRQVKAGKLFANPGMMEQLRARFMSKGPTDDGTPIAGLSDREVDVFRRLGQGQSNKQIAEDLRVSLKTVQTYCARIKDKLGLKDGHELARAAFRWHESEVHRP